MIRIGVEKAWEINATYSFRWRLCEDPDRCFPPIVVPRDPSVVHLFVEISSSVGVSSAQLPRRREYGAI